METNWRNYQAMVTHLASWTANVKVTDCTMNAILTKRSHPWLSKGHSPGQLEKIHCEQEWGEIRQLAL